MELFPLRYFYQENGGRIAWGTLVSPYKTFSTDGVREGDVIYTKYEYDPYYANDKFYR